MHQVLVLLFMTSTLFICQIQNVHSFTLTLNQDIHYIVVKEDIT